MSEKPSLRLEHLNDQPFPEDSNVSRENSTPGEEDLEKGPKLQPQDNNIFDPNEVTWEDAADPLNPKNWRLRSKILSTFLISCFLLVTLMSSTIISPALSAIAATLNIEGGMAKDLSMSVFVLGYTFGPLLLGPLSEIYGRVIVVQVSNVWFVVWTVVCAVATTKAQIIVARFMVGAGGSAALAIGGGILSDIWKPEHRGRSIAVYNFVPLLGPAIGPIIGGYISQRASWRWCFWVVGIFGGVLTTISLFTFRESYAPIILHRKAKQLRKSTGNQEFYTKFERQNNRIRPTLARNLSRPFILLLKHPIIQFLSLYGAYCFGLLYIIHTTYATLWIDRYHQAVSASGLNFISIAIGFTLAAQVAGPITDRIWQHLKQKAEASSPNLEGQPMKVVPEYRVPLMIPGALLVPIGLLIYGWTAQEVTHWIGPNIGIAIFSAGINVSSQCQTAYLVDAYPEFTASALAASSVLKSLAGFGFPLFAPSLYETLDYGWGNTLLAGIALIIGLPMPWALWKYGASLRAKRQIVL